LKNIKEAMELYLEADENELIIYRENAELKKIII